MALAILTGASLPVRAASLPALTAVALVVSVGASFLGMAADSLMAHATAPGQRGAAGGWSQAGNLGGAGVGVSAGLAVVSLTHSLLLAGCAIAALTSLCALALLFAPASRSLPKGRNYLQTLKSVAQDCWSVCRARLGWLTLFLFVLPLGAAARPTSPPASRTSGASTLACCPSSRSAARSPPGSVRSSAGTSATG